MRSKRERLVNGSQDVLQERPPAKDLGRFLSKPEVRKTDESKFKQESDPKKKQKSCPFNPDLKCEDCRLWVKVPYGDGKRDCAFILAAVR